MDTALFKKAMGKNVTGITVVTSGAGDERHGMTVNAYLSVSVSPPKLLVSLSKTTRTAELVVRTRKFAVNLLAQDQSPQSDRFAGRHKDKEADRFEGIPWEAGKTEVPLLKGALGRFECKVVQIFDGGDHHLVLGEVVAGDLDEGKSPLVYSKGGYHTLDHLAPV